LAWDFEWLGAPNFKARTGGVRGAWVRGEVMHITMSAGEVRCAGAANMVHIHALERNGQGHVWPGHTGDHEIPPVAGALLLEKQRKGRVGDDRQGLAVSNREKTTTAHHDVGGRGVDRC
jgi:predicted DNA-binding protein with PD1-like motif